MLQGMVVNIYLEEKRVNLQNLWKCKVFKAYGDLLFISTYLKYLSPSCTIVLLWWTSFVPWNLPSIPWSFVRNRKWVSWFALQHSRSGLSSDQILLWILILSPPPSFPFLELPSSLLLFLWKLIFAKDLIMFLNEFSLKLQDKTAYMQNCCSQVALTVNIIWTTSNQTSWGISMYSLIESDSSAM